MQKSTRNYLLIGIAPLVAAAEIYYLSHKIKDKDLRDLAVYSILFPVIGGTALSIVGTVAEAEENRNKSESELVKKAQTSR